MKQSDSIVNLAAALVSAQAEMPPVPMDSENPFLKNKFASLGSVIRTISPVLKKHGLAVVTMPVTSLNQMGICVRVIHESGEWLESDFFIPMTEEKGKSQAQVAGSIITYLRRYSLGGIFRLFTDDDTDGNVPGKKEEEERHFTADQAQWLVEGGFAKNKFEAEGMLNHSKTITQKTPRNNVLFWGKNYRAAREGGMESADAGLAADEEYNAQLARVKQDKAGPA